MNSMLNVKIEKLLGERLVEPYWSCCTACGSSYITRIKDAVVCTPACQRYKFRRFGVNSKCGEATRFKNLTEDDLM